MATDDVDAITESGEPLCCWCRASFVLPLDVFCGECRAILTGTVTDWLDDDSFLPSAVDHYDRPAA